MPTAMELGGRDTQEKGRSRSLSQGMSATETRGAEGDRRAPKAELSAVGDQMFTQKRTQ